MIKESIMKLFGTDGVRGKAGDFLDVMTALKLAQATGVYFNTISTTKIKRYFLVKTQEEVAI